MADCSIPRTKLTCKPGDRFGCLVVLAPPIGGTKRLKRSVECRCDCGTVRLVRVDFLCAGRRKSCGKCRVSEDRREASNTRWERQGRRVLLGLRYGRLMIIEDLGCQPQEHMVMVRCDCGTVKRVRWKVLIRIGAQTKSCGCLRAELTSARRLKHGHRRNHAATTPEYQAWCAMIQRCTNAGRPDAKNYVLRGVTACERWRNSFEAFLKDVGARPSPLHSLDRYPDNNGNYEPGNVRWATRAEQRANQRTRAEVAADDAAMGLARLTAAAVVDTWAQKP